MEGFLRRLQTVVDVEEDAPAVDVVLQEMPTDTAELQRRLQEALALVRSSSEKWEDLYSESCKIEAELAALRLRFKTSRENWVLVQELNQKTIDALVGELFNAAGEDISTSLDNNDGNSYNVPPPTDNMTYVSSLQEQVATLKQLVRGYAEERDHYKLEIEKLSASKATQEECNGDDSTNSAGFNKNVIITDLSVKEDPKMQDYIAKLETELCRQSRAISKMTLQHRTYLDGLKGTKDKKDVQLQEIQEMKRELEAWRQGRGADHVNASSNSIAASPEYAEDNEIEVLHEPSTSAVEKKNSLGKQRPEMGSGDLTHEPTQDLLKQLEETHAESNAREEALNTLYQDVCFLRERNSYLEQQLTDVEEELHRMREDLMTMQDARRLEEEHSKELKEQLESMKIQLQKNKRELASSNEECRRLRLQLNGSIFNAENAHAFSAASPLLTISSAGSNGDGDGGRNVKPFDISVSRKFQNVERTPAGDVSLVGRFNRNSAWSGVMRVMGQRWTIIILLSIIVTVLLLVQINLVSPDPDSVVLRLQSDLLACQHKLGVQTTVNG